MSRSFDGSAESTATVEQIHAAFVREDYWLARLATGEATTALDSLVVTDSGAVAVHVTQYLGRQLLPGLVAKLVTGDLKLKYAEKWTPCRDRQVRGHVEVGVSGGLGTCRAEVSLAPAVNGSHLRFAGRVDAKIPLLGSSLEKSIGADVAESIPSVLRFTTTWIGRQP